MKHAVSGLLAMTVAATAGAAARNVPVDQWVVPRCAKAPVIDGRLSAGEWDRAAAVTGFQHIFGYMTERQVVGYVTYDDQRIYFAFDSRFPPGQKLRRVARERDHRRLCADDAIEIWIAPDADHPEVLEYQFLGNSLEVIQDFLRRPNIGNVLQRWNGNWLYKCTTAPGRWQAEVAIDRREIGLEGTDKPFGVNLCRDYAQYEFTNVTYGGFNNYIGSSWGADGPAVQLLDLGDILKADLKARLAIHAGARAAKVRFTVDVSQEVDGKPVASGAREETVAAGQRAEIVLAVPWADKAGPIAPFTGDRTGAAWSTWVQSGRKRVVFQAVEADTGRVLLRHHLPVKEGMTDLGPVGPARAFEVFADLYPTYGLLRAGADIFDFPAKARVARVGVEIVRPGGQETCGRGEIAEFKLGFGETAIKHAPLTDGTYRAVFRAMDSAGQVLAEESVDFQKKSFPWQGTKVGVSDEVIPPFTPLRVAGKVLHCWGRQYHFADTGLPEQIVTRGAAVLARPITLDGQADGRPLAFQAPARFQWTVQKPGVVEHRARSAAGNLGLTVHARTEYDGMTKFTLGLEPTGGPVKVERLSLLVPLHDRHATLFHACGESIRMTNRAGYVPEGRGVVWTSREVPNAVVLGTFIPYWWLGDHDRGLCWMADNDKGWSTDATEPGGGQTPAVEFVREGSVLTARVNLFTQAKTLTKPVEIVFALQAGPCKPEPVGWRLAELPGNPSTLPGQPARLRLGWYCNVRTFQGYGKPPDMDQYLAFVKKYREQHGTGWGVNMSPNDLWGVTEENQYYVAEWSPGLPTPERNDYVMYNLDQLMAAGWIDGLYSDDVYPVADNNLVNGTGYVRDDGRVQYGYRLFDNRDFYKRSAYLHWKHKCKFGTLVHMTDSMILPCYGFWTGKHDNEWGIRGGRHQDHIDTWPLGEIAARSMSRQWGMTATWHTPAPGHGDDLQCLLLLHDIYGRVESYQDRCLPAQLLFGLAEPDVEFLGYWELRCRTEPERARVLASAWVRPSWRTALVAIANLSETDWTGTIHLPLERLGVPAEAVACDGEDEHASLPMTAGALRIAVPRHNYRLVLVGARGVFPADLPAPGASLSRPARLIAELGDDFNGPSLSGAWRVAAAPAAEAEIAVYRRRLCVKAAAYKFGTAERDLGQDNVTVQVRVERAGRMQNRVGLALVWADGHGLFAGPNLNPAYGKFEYSLFVGGKERQRRWGSPVGFPHPGDMHQPNWVRVRLTPETIYFSGSSDGRTWQNDWAVARPAELAGPPRVLRLGETPDGAVAAIHAGEAYNYFDDLIVGRD